MSTEAHFLLRHIEINSSLTIPWLKAYSNKNIWKRAIKIIGYGV